MKLNDLPLTLDQAVSAGWTLGWAVIVGFIFFNQENDAVEDITLDNIEEYL